MNDVELRSVSQQLQHFLYQRVKQKPKSGWLAALDGLDEAGEATDDDDIEYEHSDDDRSTPKSNSAVASLTSGSSKKSGGAGPSEISEENVVDQLVENVFEGSDEPQGSGSAGGDCDSSATSQSSSSGSSSTSSSSSSSPSPDLDDQVAGEVVIAVDVPAVVKGSADAVIWTPHGVLRIYTAMNGNRTLVAHCPQHGNNCRLSRSLHEGRKLGQGKPLGLVLCWLMSSSVDGVDSQSSHLKVFVPIDKGGLGYPCPSIGDRLAARTEFKLLDGAAYFLHAEVQGGDEEPDRIS